LKAKLEEMLAKMKARIEDDNDNFEVLRDGCLSGDGNALSRKDGGHGFGGKPRGNAIRSGALGDP
jgi:hypothetical protein